MAISSTMEWDVRTTGSDTNGGGFRPNTTGTDYSLQNSPQVTYTDLRIGGSANQLLSTLNPFSSNHVGNIVNIISGGAGFNTGRFEVLSVAGVTATMDRTLGTVGSTAGIGNLGGAVASISIPMAAQASGNSIWVKSGTYSITTTLTMLQSGILCGYESVHGDKPTVNPEITTSVNNIRLLTITGIAGLKLIKNFKLSCTASPAISGSSVLGITGAVASLIFFEYCEITGFYVGVIATSLQELAFMDCYLHDFVLDIAQLTTGKAAFTRCILANAVGGIQITAPATPCSYYFNRCRISDVVNACIQLITGIQALFQISNCTFANAETAFYSTLVINTGCPLNISNSIFWGLSVQAIFENTSAPTNIRSRVSFKNNAFGGNGADYAPTWLGDYAIDTITLTDNPFTDDSTQDYSLNNDSGGGLLCKGSGFQLS